MSRKRPRELVEVAINGDELNGVGGSGGAIKDLETIALQNGVVASGSGVEYSPPQVSDSR